MIKVVIAEDEPLILRGIKRMIEQTHEGFEVVGEAYDGEEALNIIEKLQPDVLFTDIRMPVIDGLDLIVELQKRKINILPIILSGYHEFDYAKKAIKLGVVDYLLKPLSPDVLEGLLNDIYGRLTDKRKESQLKTLRNIINNKKDLSNAKIEFPKYKEFSYLLICSGSYCTYPSIWLTPANEFWIENDLEYIVTKSFGNAIDFWVMDGHQGNEKILVMAYKENFKEEDIYNFSNQLHGMLTQIGFPITTIAGNRFNDINNLAYLIQQSKLTLIKKIIFGQSQIILNGNIESNTIEDNLSYQNFEKTLSVIIKNSQKELCRQEIKKLLNECKDKSYSQLALEKLLKQLINIFSNILDFIPQKRILDIYMEIDESISTSVNYETILEGIDFIVDELFQTKKSKTNEEDDQKILADKLQKYIEANFTKQLTLPSLSDMYGLVPSYLSRIFKKHKGISPSDYIIKLRIEKAKELLLIQPPFILIDIAETVGYNDPFYLSRIFKSVTGMRPSEYRIMMKL